jgi:hypothetical protein
MKAAKRRRLLALKAKGARAKQATFQKAIAPHAAPTPVRLNEAAAHQRGGLVFVCVSAPFGFVAQYVIERRNHDVTKRAALRGLGREGIRGKRALGFPPGQGMSAQRLFPACELAFRAWGWRVPA